MEWNFKQATRNNKVSDYQKRRKRELMVFASVPKWHINAKKLILSMKFAASICIQTTEYLLWDPFVSCNNLYPLWGKEFSSVGRTCNSTAAVCVWKAFRVLFKLAMSHSVGRTKRFGVWQMTDGKSSPESAAPDCFSLAVGTTAGHLPPKLLMWDRWQWSSVLHFNHLQTWKNVLALWSTIHMLI